MQIFTILLQSCNKKVPSHWITKLTESNEGIWFWPEFSFDYNDGLIEFPSVGSATVLLKKSKRFTHLATNDYGRE